MVTNLKQYTCLSEDNESYTSNHSRNEICVIIREKKNNRENLEGETSFLEKEVGDDEGARKCHLAQVGKVKGTCQVEKARGERILGVSK